LYKIYKSQTNLPKEKDAPTGAIIGGLSNAINSINNTLVGLTSKLNALINSVGNMGSINLNVNCKCMAFDFSVDLRQLLAPISSWLTDFAAGLKIPNPFAGLHNPFHLNPNLGCPQSMLGNIGSIIGK
jgi:hypothetical protein